MELIIDEKIETEVIFGFGDIVVLEWKSLGVETYLVVPCGSDEYGNDLCSLVPLGGDGEESAFGFHLNLQQNIDYIKTTNTCKFLKVYKAKDYVLKLERRK